MTITAIPSKALSTQLSSQHSKQGAATKMRLTVRGRRVLAVLFIVPLLTGLIALSLVFASGAGASVENGSVDFTYITVGHGETLWALAAEVAPNNDPRDVVAEFKQLNALSSSTVQPGQQLAIPAQYSR